MAKNKTTKTNASAADFIAQVEDPVKRGDSFRISGIMQEETGFEPEMWGPSIIGFGHYHYKYESGHEGDAPLIGFSPRSNAISLYLAPGFERREELLKQFGKHSSGKGCLYIKKLDDINIDVFKEMIRDSVEYLKTRYDGY